MNAAAASVIARTRWMHGWMRLLLGQQRARGRAHQAAQPRPSGFGARARIVPHDGPFAVLRVEKGRKRGCRRRLRATARWHHLGILERGGQPFLEWRVFPSVESVACFRLASRYCTIERRTVHCNRGSRNPGTSHMSHVSLTSHDAKQRMTFRHPMGRRIYWTPRRGPQVRRRPI
jgi:hypothetical protein